MEPLSVGVWACRKAGVSAGDRVLVTGAGPIGLLAMQCALAFGATEVTVSDVNEHRLEVARRTGATRTLTPDEGLEHEVDALLECSGHPAAVADGIRALRPAGVAVLVGMGPEEEGTLPLSIIKAARSGSPAPFATPTPTRPWRCRRFGSTTTRSPCSARWPC